MAATRQLRVRTAGAALAAGALLTAGCAGTSGLSPAAITGEPSAPASESPSESPVESSSPGPSATPSPAPGTEEPAPEGSTSDDLRDRLLPASAFGADATVVGITLDQLGAAGPGWGGWGGHWGHDGDGDHDGWADEVTVEPEGCRAALEALEGLEGLEGLDDEAGDLVWAAQAARTPQAQTVQVLAESPQIAELQLPVDQLLAECGTVTATGPWGWSATVEATPLDVPELGQQSAAVQVTVDWAGRESVSVLVGLVVDGSRGLLLAQSAAPDAAAPDAAAFTALLTEAAETAAG